MNRKKLIIFTIALLALGLVGCGQGKEESMVIGINQFMEHRALDDAREAFVEEIHKIDPTIKIDYLNAQGDFAHAQSISKKFEKDKVDLIFAIGTPSAQSSMKLDIPVLFTAVTDPEAAGLVKSLEEPGKNMSGTSDKADSLEQLQLFKELDPAIKKIGVIYNTSEANSEAQLKELEKDLNGLDLELEVLGINNINEINQAIEALLKKVDGLYLLADNMIASSIPLISKSLIKQEIVSVSAEESQVRGGALITKGISYRDLGRQTALMAQDVLINGKDINKIPVGLSKNKDVKINMKTLEALKLNKKQEIFKDALIID